MGISRLIAALLTIAASLVALPAVAGPAFAYSWLSTERSFERCMLSAQDIMATKQYPHVRTTRFGVTGETTVETLYINCEDQRHVSMILMRREPLGHSDIDAIAALMQQRLDANGE
jgi:hypothetical protein